MSTIANILGWVLLGAFEFIAFIVFIAFTGEICREIQRQRKLTSLPPHHPPETDVRDLA